MIIASDALEYERIDEDDEVNATHNVQRYTDAVEAAVRAYPEQWTWLHRRWKRPPPEVAERLAESGDAGKMASGI